MKGRPKCPGCGRRLKPTIYQTRDLSQRDGVNRQARYWSGHYDGYGAFCTLRCASAWANNVVQRSERHYERPLRYYSPNLWSKKYRRS